MPYLNTTLPKIRAWSQSLNARLFLAVAILTSVLTIAVAFLIISGIKRSVESYTRDLALGTARGVVEDINRLDPELKFRRETAGVLAAWVNPDSIRQIDIFTAAIIDGKPYVEVWASSENRPEEVFRDDGEIMKMMELAGEAVNMITLKSGQAVWRVYMPITDGSYGKKPKAILRVYCNLDRWNAIWKSTYVAALIALSIVLFVEFALLWILTSVFVRRPMHRILKAMSSLGSGDVNARANLRGQDELGQIAARFDTMANELQTAGQEKETLLREISGFNTTLQERIDAALYEIKAKNDELERLMERVSLLREELGQQERLAVAGQLTAAFAHEVGTPLNLVNSHLQLLISEPVMDSRTKERLNTIQAQINRVGEIVKKLLGQTRTIEPKRELVSLLPLLNELHRLWGPTLAVRNVTFQANISETCVLYVDHKQIEQLLINLVNNAVDAMPGGGSIRLEGSRSQEGTKGSWEFALSDTGVGVPPEVLGKVFKPMFTTKPEGKGTGLGLSICREIVRANGGEIGMENRENGGAVVRFSLPAHIVV